MKIGMCIEAVGLPASFEERIGAIVQAERDGWESVWMGSIGEALVTYAVAGRETSRIELLSAVTISYPRHPVALAQEALFTGAAAGGRFVLGIGPAQRARMEALGYSYDQSAASMREYVSVVHTLVNTGKVSFQGEHIRAEGAAGFPWLQPLPVLISALGPLMLRAAGEVSDGTVTWLAGPETLRSYIIPRIQYAAQQAGRRAPRISAGLPVAVTDDRAAARSAVAEQFSRYTAAPHYRRLIEREGGQLGDVALIGDEQAVETKLRALAALGVSEFYAYPFASAGDGRTMERTRELLLGLVGKV